MSGRTSQLWSCLALLLATGSVSPQPALALCTGDAAGASTLSRWIASMQSIRDQSPHPVDADAAPEARALHARLYRISSSNQDQILFGQQGAFLQGRGW